MQRSHVIVLVVFLLATSAGFLSLTIVPPTSGQQQFPDTTRKIACGCFCGGSSPDYVIFSKDADCAGILAADACGRELGSLPPARLDAICKFADENRGKGSCPTYQELCGSRKKGPDSKCENKPTPWFDRSTPCADVQEPQVTLVGSEVKLSYCGFPIFRYDPPDNKDPLGREEYRLALLKWVKQTAGSKICCSSFRKSMQTGDPCNPAVDIDCDGKPNQTDVNTTTSSSRTPLPAIDFYSSPTGSAIDPFPSGLNPDDPNFMPNTTARDSKGVGACACKWELIRGDLKCSPDGQQQHVYVATWRCPSNKTEVMTTKYAPATAPCSKGSTKALLFLSERLSVFGE